MDNASFWQAQFARLEAQLFPILPSATHQPRAELYVIHYTEDIIWPRSSITAARAIRPPWSILTPHLRNSSNVVFGVTMSSRQVAVHQINEMTGPNFACMNGLQLGAVC